MTETTELDTPIDDGFGNETEEIPQEMASRAASLVSEYPPTNANVLIDLIDYWNDISSYNDPVVKSAVAWTNYILHEDTSQMDAGLNMDSHEELTERLDELGIDHE